MRRPTTTGRDGGSSRVTTPRAADMSALLGSRLRIGGLALTNDEYRAAERLYGYHQEQPRERPQEPVDPGQDASWEDRRAYKARLAAWQSWTDPREFMQAGADRNLARNLEADGVRLVAWLARYVAPGEDPLRALIRMACDARLDVDPEDVAWAEAEDAGADDGTEVE